MVRWKVHGNNFVHKECGERGMIADGERLVVACGKTKKVCNADVVRVPSASSRSNVPPTTSKSKTPAATRREKEAPFVFEFAAPAQCQNKQATPCAILKMLDDLKDDLQDAISGDEARLLVRLHSIEEKVTLLQREIVRKCALPPLDYSVFPPPVDYSAFTPTAPLWALPSESTTHSTPTYQKLTILFPVPTPMWLAPQAKTSRCHQNCFCSS